MPEWAYIAIYGFAAVCFILTAILTAHTLRYLREIRRLRESDTTDKMR